MKLRLLKSVIAGLMMLSCGLANATLIKWADVDFNVTQDQAGIFNFTTFNANDFVVFDALAWESDGVDYFSNGENNDFFDVEFWLFDSWDISTATLLTQNDDYIGTDLNGSVSFLDSYIEFTFANPGQYALVLAHWTTSLEDVRLGLSTFGGNVHLDAYWEDGRTIPEPSTIAIFALGIMGLASRRFKKQ